MLKHWVIGLAAFGLSRFGFGDPPKPTPDIQKLIDAATKLPADQQLAAFQAAIPKAVQAGDKDGEGVLYVRCGYCEAAAFQLDAAEKDDRLALDLFRSAKDDDMASVTLNNLGQLYNSRGQNKEAMEFFNQALPLAQKVEDLTAQEIILGNLGLANSTMGDKPTALSFDQQALAVAIKTGDRTEEGVLRHNIGSVYCDLGDNAKGLDYLSQALSIAKEVGDRAMAATIQIAMGRAYADLGQNQKALDVYKEALPVEHETNSKRAEATVLSNMGQVYATIGQPQKAVQLFDQALAIEREIQNQLGEATILSNMGEVYGDIGQYQKALDIFQQTLKLKRELGDKKGVGTSLGNIGKAYSDMGQNQKALDYYGQSLAIEREIGNRKDEAAALSNIGRVYANLGQNQKALELDQQALTIKQQIGDKVGEGSVLDNIASVYMLEGQNQKALDLFQQALQIEREVGDKTGEATALSNIGALYGSLGQTDKALDFYNRALPIRRAVGDRSGEAYALNNIATEYSRSGRNERALGFYEQALPIEQEIGDQKGQGLTLGNMGAAYMALGKNDVALSFYVKALPIQRAVGDRATEATTLSNMGSAYLNLGQDKKGIDSAQNALPIEREVGDRSTEAITLQSLEYVYGKSDPELAIWYGKRAVNLYQDLRKDISGLDRQTRDVYKQTVSGAYRALADLLAGQGRLGEAEQVLRLLKQDELYEYVRRSERSLVEDSAEYTSDEAAWDKEYETQTAGLADLARQVEELKASGADSAKLDALNDQLAQKEQLFQGFLKRVLARAQAMGVDTEKLKLATGTDLEAKSVSGPLAKMSKEYPGVAAVYAFVAPDALRLFYFSPGHMQGRVSVIKAADLNKKILAFRQALTDPRSDPRLLGKELYDLLVKPIEPDLAGTHATRIMWSLDGQLRYLPVAALYDGKQYLVEKYDLSLFTPADMADLVAPADVKWTGLVAGVSKAHTVTDTDGTVAVFPGLSGVPAELQGVKSAVPGSTELLDADFTDATFIHALNRSPSLVHLATHFAFRPGDETKSYLLTGDGKPFRVADARTLSEASLQGVSLLTLSACETALGGSDGSEVESLSVVLEKKGAESVLATLWPVADASTSLLMAEFYRLREGHPEWTKAHALREAQVEMLHGGLTGKGADTRSARVSSGAGGAEGFEHPYYWAPFVLSGNWK